MIIDLQQSEALLLRMKNKVSSYFFPLEENVEFFKKALSFLPQCYFEFCWKFI